MPRRDPVKLDITRHPWERQEGEPELAWMAFTDYLETEPAKRHIGKEADRSAKWRWRERAAKYDRWQDGIRRDALVAAKREEIEQQADEMVQVAADLWRLAGKGARAYLKKMAEWEARCLEAEEYGSPIPKCPITPREVEMLAGTGIKLHQVLRGEPDSIIGQRDLTWARLVEVANEEEPFSVIDGGKVEAG
jgi:hypothetical protein